MISINQEITWIIECDDVLAECEQLARVSRKCNVPFSFSYLDEPNTVVNLHC